MSIILDTIPIQTFLGRSQTEAEAENADIPNSHPPLNTLMASRFGFTCTPEDRSLYHQAAKLHFPDGFEGLAPNRITAPWVREVLRIAARCQIAGVDPVERLRDILEFQIEQPTIYLKKVRESQ